MVIPQYFCSPLFCVSGANAYASNIRWRIALSRLSFWRNWKYPFCGITEESRNIGEKWMQWTLTVMISKKFPMSQWAAASVFSSTSWRDYRWSPATSNLRWDRVVWLSLLWAGNQKVVGSNPAKGNSWTPVIELNLSVFEILALAVLWCLLCFYPCPRSWRFSCIYVAMDHLTSSQSYGGMLHLYRKW